MKIAVGILTYNVLSQLRTSLLDETVRSVRAAFPDSAVLIVDNGSNDGSAEHVRATYDDRETDRVVVVEAGLLVSLGGGTSPGAGDNRLLACLEAWDADALVLSDDDMRWRPGAAAAVRDIWKAAPDDLVCVSGLLEPLWHWNTPRETLKLGSNGLPYWPRTCVTRRVLVRDSVPGAAMTFSRAALAEVRVKLGREQLFEESFGHDSAFCCKVRELGLRVAQVDLAEHLGWDSSSHGNNAIATAQALDHEQWEMAPLGIWRPCERCGASDAEFDPWPSEAELCGDLTPVWACEDCRYLDAQDI